MLGHTKLKSLAFFQDLRKTVSARNGLVFLRVCGLAHLATALARVDGILALHGRLEAWRLHGFLMCAEEYGSSVVGGAVLRSSGASRRASHGHPEARAVER